jgi:hypothetical protein
MLSWDALPCWTSPLPACLLQVHLNKRGYSDDIEYHELAFETKWVLPACTAPAKPAAAAAAAVLPSLILHLPLA